MQDSFHQTEQNQQWHSINVVQSAVKTINNIQCVHIILKYMKRGRFLKVSAARQPKYSVTFVSCLCSHTFIIQVRLYRRLHMLTMDFLWQYATFICSFKNMI